MADVVGTHVIGVVLDDSKVGPALAKIDKKMQDSLGKARVMSLVPVMQKGWDVPATSASGGSAARGIGKISAASKGRGGAGMMQQMGAAMGMDSSWIKGMAPYIRAGKGGMYGGLSGIDVIGSLKGLMGGGKATASAGQSSQYIRKLASSAGHTKPAGVMIGKGSDVAYTGGKMGQAAVAGGRGAGVVASSAGGAAGLAGMSVPVIGLIVAAVVGIAIIAKKILKAIKETSVWKWLSNMLRGIVGSFMGVIMMGAMIVRSIHQKFVNAITLFAGPVGLFISALGVFIDFFAEKSVKERIQEALDSFSEMITRSVTNFFG